MEDSGVQSKASESSSFPLPKNVAKVPQITYVPHVREKGQCTDVSWPAHAAMGPWKG